MEQRSYRFGNNGVGGPWGGRTEPQSTYEATKLVQGRLIGIAFLLLDKIFMENPGELIDFSGR